MKRLKRKSKIFIALFCLFAFIGLFAFSTCAYSLDDNGNMVSDNLMPTPSVSQTTIASVTYYIDDYGYLRLDGTSSSGSWQNYSTNTFTLSSGTYTIQWFTDLTINGVGYGLYNSTTGDIYQLNTNRYNTFTLNTSITFSVVVWWQSSGIVFNNNYIGAMVYSGEYDSSMSYEPYGYIWYSQDNYNTYGSNQYDVGYTTGVNEGALSGVGSVLYYKNLDFAWFRYYPLNQNFEHYIVFVYNGELGWWEGSSIFDFDPDSFDTSTPASWLESTVVHLYGFFGYTDYDDSLGAFIEGSDSYTSADPDKSCTLNFEFSTPLSLQNISFEMSGFTECTFYSGTWQYLQPLAVYTSSDISGVTLSNVRGVECYWSLADVWNNNCYLHSNVYDGYYNSGYTNGYNTARAEYIGQVQDLQSKVDFLQSSLQEMRVTLNEAINGGNYSHLIWTIAASPWESFKNIWNVNFLGINIASVVTGFITALLILYIIKKVF